MMALIPSLSPKSSRQMTNAQTIRAISTTIVLLLVSAHDSHVTRLTSLSYSPATLLTFARLRIAYTITHSRIAPRIPSTMMLPVDITNLLPAETVER